MLAGKFKRNQNSVFTSNKKSLVGKENECPEFEVDDHVPQFFIENDFAIQDSSYFFPLDHQTFSIETRDSISERTEKSFVTNTEALNETNNAMLPEFLSHKIKKNKHNDKKAYKMFSNQIENSHRQKYRNHNLNSFITQLRQYYKDENLINTKKNKQQLTRRILKLKWLPKTFINPKQECRYMDYMFPLDSNQFDQDSTVISKYYFKLPKIKRITSIEKNLKTNSYKLLFEDNNQQNATGGNSNRNFDVEYFKNWLMSLGNAKAMCFKYYLDNYQELLQKSSNEIVANDNLYGALNENNKDGKNEIFYLEKLNESTKHCITNSKRMEYISEIVYESDLHTGLMELKSMEFSKLATDIIQVYPSLQDGKHGFSFVDRLMVKDYYGHFLGSIINKNMKKVDTRGIEEPILSVDIRYYNNNGYCGTAIAAQFRERYIQNSRVYVKMIATMVYEDSKN